MGRPELAGVVVAGRGVQDESVLKLRRYDEKDAATVWRLHEDALRQMNAHAGHGPWDDDLRSVRASYLEDRELGYRSLRLDTTVSQVPAQHLYLSSGYGEVGRTRLRGQERIRFERRLS